MHHTVLKYAPNYWNTHSVSLDDMNQQFLLSSSSDEYRQIRAEVNTAVQNSYGLAITSIERNQNIHDLGQLILREQLLKVLNPHHEYYRVRRFTTVKKHFLNNALGYNLDHRRCGKAHLTFQKYITCDINDLIIAVQVITTDKNANCIEPKNTSEYFIDYIVNIKVLN